jgi:hypothetical protein
MPAGTNRWRPASTRIPLFILSPRPLVIFVHKSAAVALWSHLLLSMALEECSLSYFTKCPQWRYRRTPHEVTSHVSDVTDIVSQRQDHHFLVHGTSCHSPKRRCGAAVAWLSLQWIVSITPTRYSQCNGIALF